MGIDNCYHWAESIRNHGEFYAMDLNKKKMHLNGYGCVYSMATISYLNRNVKQYEEPCVHEQKSGVLCDNS